MIPSKRSLPARVSRLAILGLSAVGVGVQAFAASAPTDRIQELTQRASQLTPDKARGLALYQTHCAGCHGPLAQGNAPSSVPSLSGQVRSYLIKQLATMIESRRTVPEMHRVMAKAELSRPQAVSDLTAYLNAQPVAPSPEVGDGKGTALGAQIYQTVCTQCHGVLGAGDEKTGVPAVRGQHYSYLLLQSRQLAAGHRYRVDSNVMAMLQAMSIDQMTGVADFMSRMKMPAPLNADCGKRRQWMC